MKKLLLPLLIFFMTACGGKKNNPQPAEETPGKALLNSPAQNELCTGGNVITAGETTVTLAWSLAARTNSYEVIVKNLLTGITTTTVTTTNVIQVPLLRNTPYSWYVTSKANSGTATSETWKFYVAGPATTSYSPFPAGANTPAAGQILSNSTTVVNLTWIGSDVDNDITGYDLYFGTNANPPLLKSNLTDQFLNNIAVTAATNFYWKVITRDAHGNSSDSGVYQFKVN